MTNATLTDTLPGLLRFVPTTWSCTASAGSSCTAYVHRPTSALSRSGSVSLLSGGTATYTLVGSVPLTAPLGTSTNSVTIASAIDPNPANNTLADTDNIVRVSPVSFTGASGAASLNPLATTLAFGQRERCLVQRRHANAQRGARARDLRDRHGDQRQSGALCCHEGCRYLLGNDEEPRRYLHDHGQLQRAEWQQQPYRNLERALHRRYG